MVNLFQFFFKCVAAIKVKMSQYFPLNGKMSQLQHLICYLCSIGNKTWVYEVWKSLHSIFIYVLHSFSGIEVVIFNNTTFRL